MQSMPKAGFDETVELSFKLNVDPKQSNQMVAARFASPTEAEKRSG